MDIAWSRISSKVIAIPPYVEAACTRLCGNGQSRSDVCIPHMVDQRKQEVLGARYTESMPCAQRPKGLYHERLDCLPLPPHGSQEGAMSPYTRHLKQHAKAKQRRRLTAHERMARDRH